MKVTYSPEGGEVQSWTFRPAKVNSSQAIITQKAYGKPWEQFAAEVQQGDIAARRILLWHLMRADHPVTRLEDVPDFCVGELVIEHEADELRDMLASAEANSAAMPADQRDMALGMLRAQLAAAEVAEPEAAGGKASSKKGS